MGETTANGTSGWWQSVDKSQVLKWTVYSLLLLNMVYYAVEEAYIASHTLPPDAPWWDWAEAFATTIDEFAWFGLLFMFELETYILEDEAFERPWVGWLLHGLRLLCYLMLAHTVIARYTTLVDVMAVPPATEYSTLCDAADQDLSWGENYRYKVITSENCASLPAEGQLYWLEDGEVLTDSDGLQREKNHVWVDMSDALTWLLVIWSIELAVWLQNRNITGGRLMFVSRAAKFFYLVLFSHAAWWAWTGHWLYSWDQFLWIGGFWAIENNLAEWRDEIREEKATSANPETVPIEENAS